MIQSNTAWLYGGGCSESTLTNCLISSNNCPGYSYNSEGGGLFDSVAVGCLISNNTAYFSGGGASQSFLDRCTVIANFAPFFLSGGGGGTKECIVNNSIIRSNSAYGASGGVLNNSTVTHNSGGTYNVIWANNSIVYYNSGTNTVFVNAIDYWSGCCTPDLLGPANFTNAPLFVNANGGDFHLSSNSPCINAGNNSYYIWGYGGHPLGNSDFDGNARVSGGTADAGAYEFQSPVSRISYVWLGRYGLLPSGSIDVADPDLDGMSNYKEWISGTDPTNSSSLLKMLPLSRTNTASGVLVQWQSAYQKTYFLERAVDLSATGGFSLIQSNVFSSQDGIMSYIDRSATNQGPYFYRVGVQN